MLITLGGGGVLIVVDSNIDTGLDEPPPFSQLLPLQRHLKLSSALPHNITIFRQKRHTIPTHHNTNDKVCNTLNCYLPSHLQEQIKPHPADTRLRISPAANSTLRRPINAAALIYKQEHNMYVHGFGPPLSHASFDDPMMIIINP